MQNKENQEYIKESLASIRAIIPPLFTMLIVTVAGICAIVKEANFNEINVGLLGIGLVFAIVLIGYILVLLEEQDKFRKLLKKD